MANIGADIAYAGAGRRLAWSLACPTNASAQVREAGVPFGLLGHSWPQRHGVHLLGKPICIAPHQALGIKFRLDGRLAGKLDSGPGHTPDFS